MIKSAVAVALAVTMLTGCGARAADQSAVTDAVTQLAQALDKGDGAAGCERLAPATRAELADSQGSTCAAALLDQRLSDGGAVRRVDVYGRTARLVLDGDTVFLARFSTGWLVTAAGCRPRPDRPYQCAVKGG